MLKRIIFLMVLCMFTLTNMAFATNWGYIGRDNSAISGDYDAYVDKDSIVMNGHNVIFWESQVLDKVNDKLGGSKNDLFQLEAITSSPRQIRVLEYYSYDANGKEIDHMTAPQEKFTQVSNSITNQEIDFALQYAK